MGLQKDTNIPIDEINAGFGYIVHLTSIIAKKVNYNFHKYDLVPMGNYSKVVAKNNPNLQFEISLTQNQKQMDKANQAISMFLECIKELNDHICEKFNYLKSTNELLNYKITNESINGYSIKYDQSNPENWGKCMKNLLTLLKSYIHLTLKKEEEEYKEILDKAQII